MQRSELVNPRSFVLRASRLFSLLDHHHHHYHFCLPPISAQFHYTDNNKAFRSDSSPHRSTSSGLVHTLSPSSPRPITRLLLLHCVRKATSIDPPNSVTFSTQQQRLLFRRSKFRSSFTSSCVPFFMLCNLNLPLFSSFRFLH